MFLLFVCAWPFVYYDCGLSLNKAVFGSSTQGLKQWFVIISSLAMFRRWKNEFLTVFWTWGSKVRLMSNIQCFVLNTDEFDNRHSGFWRSLLRRLWTDKTPLKMLAADVKNENKSNPLWIFLWRTKILEAVCKDLYSLIDSSDYKEEDIWSLFCI